MDKKVKPRMPKSINNPLQMGDIFISRYQYGMCHDGNDFTANLQKTMINA
jgi:hypothetical protein